MARIKFTEGTLIEFEVSDVKQWRLVNFFARVMETKQEEGLKASPVYLASMTRMGTLQSSG